MASATIFTMLYIGAVLGSGRPALAPKHVYRMSTAQTRLQSDAARVEYGVLTMKKGSRARGTPWYKDTSKETIRDDCIRKGFMVVGAVHIDKSVKTNSSEGRYSLKADFADLFDPNLTGNSLTEKISAWRETNLTPGALARIALKKMRATKDPNDFIVRFPNGETQNMTPGESSMITKSVIQDFATKFLQDPAVLWVSESGNRTVSRHEELAAQLGITFDAAHLLPDVVLVDSRTEGEDILVVFVEVISTDGPITDARKLELQARANGHPTAFVNAFADRDSKALRKTFDELAVDSFVWVAGEPDLLMPIVGTPVRHLHTFLRAPEVVLVAPVVLDPGQTPGQA